MQTSTPTPTCYLWKTWRSEPGQHGYTYDVTDNPEPPRDIQPLRFTGNAGPTDLVEAHSLFGPWTLLGTIEGVIIRARDMYEGDSIRGQDGSLRAVYKICDNHWYKHTRSSKGDGQ